MRPALLIIDVQKGFDDPYWGTRNNLEAESHIARLLKSWRRLQLPVIHVRHCSTEPNSPLRPGSVGNEFKEAAVPLDGEQTFDKSVNSAFIGTGLDEHLRSKNIGELVIVGLTTDHCVSTTTRMAGNLGYKVSLPADATATFNRLDINGNNISADDIHRIHLSSLHKEFCEVTTTDEILETVLNDN
ncbi:cysteine hydrolase [Aliikangiella marina]|uniref:Cysteine hydrolase n=1 Tax=Aliikangiella marina TaxID=1712262 RepID=A0A545TCY3_9GAMM|nr:cysteine hydrolase family protein [Aliikangiella marina]TQV75083.1 cysteine hydrolase [Aliikangiella marina]